MSEKIRNLLLLILLLLTALPALARGPVVAPVVNVEYQEECGGCHFAYQPGLLPTGSWQKVMAGLEDHFGENAELDADVVKRLNEYLLHNAADDAAYPRSRKIMRSLGAERPLRISHVPYFKAKHDEIPARLVQGNDKVRSWSNCTACHTRAAKGSYSEDEVVISGYGRWDD